MSDDNSKSMGIKRSYLTTVIDHTEYKVFYKTDTKSIVDLDETLVQSIINVLNEDKTKQEIINSLLNSDALDKYALLESPAFTGTPTVPTANLSDDSLQIANTKYTNSLIKKCIDEYNTKILNSPVFIGTPSAPTAATGNSSTQIATTEFVNNQINADLTKYAPLKSPAFTGIPTAPTVTDSNNKSTKIATTEFVQNVAAKKQDTLTFDTTPIESSTNPVTSDGIYKFINTEAGKFHKVAKTGNYNDLNNLPTIGTANTAGLTKLYTSLGDNTDGTVNQKDLKAILGTKMDISDLAAVAYSGKFDDLLEKPTGTDTKLGLTKLYPSTGDAIDGTINQSGITSLLHDTITINGTDIMKGNIAMCNNNITFDNGNGIVWNNETTTNNTSYWKEVTKADIKTDDLNTNGEVPINADYSKGTAYAVGAFATYKRRYFYCTTAITGTETVDCAPLLISSTQSASINQTNYTGTSAKATADSDGNKISTTYAPLKSPAFTGIPTAPTAATGTSTTQIATTAFVKFAVDSLVNSAPETMDTLSELSKALGDDPNFATTISNRIGTVESKIGNAIISVKSGDTENKIVATNTNGTANTIAINNVANATTVNGHTVNSNVPANAKFTDTVYTLPTASSTVLGGVKTGSNITNTSGTISVSKDNIIGALGYTPIQGSDIDTSAFITTTDADAKYAQKAAANTYSASNTYNGEVHLNQNVYVAAGKSIEFLNASSTSTYLDGSNYGGTSAKATADSDGNKISTTYAKITDLSKYVTPDDVVSNVTGSDATLVVTKNGSDTNIVINNVANATNATKATNDSDGNPINTTYVKKSDYTKITITYKGGI